MLFGLEAEHVHAADFAEEDFARLCRKSFITGDAAERNEVEENRARQNVDRRNRNDSDRQRLRQIFLRIFNFARDARHRRRHGSRQAVACWARAR